MKPLLYFLIASLFLIQLESCNDSEEPIIACEDIEPIIQDDTGLCPPKVLSYHFGVEHLSPRDQVSTLTRLGMDGMMVNIETNNLSQLQQYIDACEVKSGAFIIRYIYTSLSLDDANLMETQINTIEEIYKIIEDKDTQLQVIFSGQKQNPNAVTTIFRIADIANSYGKDLIIYPHDENAIETAEEALNYIELVNNDNVFLAVHLCHELAGGNWNRIDEVVANVAPYIKAVSISGASESEQADSSLPLWYWGIKPLNQGSYDYAPFFQALYDHGYTGPILIHTWGIKNNFNLDPEDYLPESKDILDNLSEISCN